MSSMSERTPPLSSILSFVLAFVSVNESFQLQFSNEALLTRNNDNKTQSFLLMIFELVLMRVSLFLQKWIRKCLKWTYFSIEI